MTSSTFHLGITVAELYYWSNIGICDAIATGRWITGTFHRGIVMTSPASSSVAGTTGSPAQEKTSTMRRKMSPSQRSFADLKEKIRKALDPNDVLQVELKLVERNVMNRNLREKFLVDLHLVRFMANRSELVTGFLVRGVDPSVMRAEVKEHLLNVIKPAGKSIADYTDIVHEVGKPDAGAVRHAINCFCLWWQKAERDRQSNKVRGMN